MHHHIGISTDSILHSSFLIFSSELILFGVGLLCLQSMLQLYTYTVPKNIV